MKRLKEIEEAKAALERIHLIRKVCHETIRDVVRFICAKIVYRAGPDDDGSLVLFS